MVDVPVLERVVTGVFSGSPPPLTDRTGEGSWGTGHRSTVVGTWVVIVSGTRAESGQRRDEVSDRGKGAETLVSRDGIHSGVGR